MSKEQNPSIVKAVVKPGGKPTSDAVAAAEPGDTQSPWKFVILWFGLPVVLLILAVVLKEML
ncbi:MAG: hypothetical protein FJ125_11140 [Deltaproteobacteria bacterium]|nr:hypothetical protein [Deltaproteobacteria bacterium]